MLEDRFKYNSVAVATYILAYANENRFVMNMTKLQKLLYIAYGTYLAVKNERLINEHPQAWPYGPVFPTTRNKLLKKEFSEITMDNPLVAEIKADAEMASLIRLVFNTYGARTAAYLSEWSHKPGSPWDRTVSSGSFEWGDRIPDELILEYFKTIIAPKKDG